MLGKLLKFCASENILLILLSVLLVTVMTVLGAKLNEPCDSNTTCSREIANSYCPYKITFAEDFYVRYSSCACQPGYFSTRGSKSCIRPFKLVGEPCDESPQCMFYATLQTALCLPGGKVCECPSEYTHSSDLKDCLKIVYSLDHEECVEDVQCQFGAPGPLSICVKGNEFTKHKVCRCHKDAVEDRTRGVCLRRAKNVGDSCKVQAQCTSTLKYSRCVNEICHCTPGSVPNVQKTSCLRQ